MKNRVREQKLPADARSGRIVEVRVRIIFKSEEQARDCERSAIVQFEEIDAECKERPALSLNGAESYEWEVIR